MRNSVLLTIAWLLALCASVAQAQVVVQGIYGPSPTQFTIFGSQNMAHGSISITTYGEKFSVPALTFKVRECSNWPAAAAPFYLFTLTKDITVYQGVESWVDQERVVTFPTGGIQGPNTTSIYSLHSDVVDYQGSHPFDKQCFRMTLERSGVPTKETVVGNFPIRLGAKTLVRSKPTVTITPIGATTGRVRVTTDDVFRITVSANMAYEILIKEIAPLISGTAQAGCYFTVVDDLSGEAVGRGWLSAQANIAWEVFGEPSFGEFFVSAGATRSFRIRVDSSTFNNNPNTSDSLSMQIANTCDFQWDTSAGNSGGPGLCLEPQVVPVTATVNYE